jgi:CO dehydrogenase maturation factor
MSEPTIIAYLGKGGAGKSALSALTAKLTLRRGRKVLLIDADPAMGLTTALALDGFKTMGQAREEIIHQARIASKAEEKARLAEIVDYLLLEALYETPEFSALVMGQTDTLGCFCPVNALLRDTIETIAAGYDVVIIDAEAGIEQINRQVTRAVQYPILLTDNSVRGARTAVLAAQTIGRCAGMRPRKLGVIFNRVACAAPTPSETLAAAAVPVYGVVPADPQLAERDAMGLSVLGIGDESGALQALATILSDHGILPRDDASCRQERAIG